MTPHVPIEETGTATAGMAVARALRRNTKTTKITSPIDTAIVRPTSRTDARIVVVRSCAIESWMAGGSDASQLRDSARLRSTVSDDVGARLAEHDDEHRRPAVRRGRPPGCSSTGIRDVRDVREPQCAAVPAYPSTSG